MVQIPGSLLADLAAASRAADDALRVQCCGPETPERRLGIGYEPGQVVLDLVTGQRVEVVSGTRTNYLVPPAGGQGAGRGAGETA
jgi:hypothetical protein